MEHTRCSLSLRKSRDAHTVHGLNIQREKKIFTPPPLPPQCQCYRFRMGGSKDKKIEGFHPPTLRHVINIEIGGARGGSYRSSLPFDYFVHLPSHPLPFIVSSMRNVDSSHGLFCLLGRRFRLSRKVAPLWQRALSNRGVSGRRLPCEQRCRSVVRASAEQPRRVWQRALCEQGGRSDLEANAQQARKRVDSRWHKNK